MLTGKLVNFVQPVKRRGWILPAGLSLLTESRCGGGLVSTRRWFRSFLLVLAVLDVPRCANDTHLSAANEGDFGA